MAAKKKPFETLSISDLGIDAADPNWARSIMIGIAEKPPRAAGVKIIDDGAAGDAFAEFFIQNRLV
jgi:electron transfer flavoprotein beta subunit